MQWVEGEIDDVVFRPAVKYKDHRGWLAEFFRSDEIVPEFLPVMGYVSLTHPGITRGPHEHIEQADQFGFVGPGNFRLRLWDNRTDSATYGKMMTVVVGEDNPTIVAVPPRIVHGYTNISGNDAWVFNFPNRLFAGEGRKQPVDEVRYEDMDDCPFLMGD